MTKVNFLKFICIFLFSLFSTKKSAGQNKYDFSNKIFNFQFLYNYQIPGGDIAKRFGNHSGVGFGGLLKTKTNWVISSEASLLFEGDIKELNILNNLTVGSDGGGFIVNASGTPGDYSVNMRGFSTFVKAGRLFPLSEMSKNQGILLELGVGFLQHKINIQTQSNDIPQLNQEYRKGYDRLTNGIAFNQFVGYYFHSQNRFVNFYAGIDISEAYTKNRRGYNYDLMAYDKEAKKDFIAAFRFGWMIPIYMFAKSENEFQFH